MKEYIIECSQKFNYFTTTIEANTKKEALEQFTEKLINFDIDVCDADSPKISITKGEK